MTDHPRIHPEPSRPPTLELLWPQTDVAHLVLLGEHDLANAGELDATIGEVLERVGRLVVDVSRAEFIDSTIIRTILRARQRAEAEGVGFNLLVGTSAIVRRALEVSEVLPRLEPVESLEEALHPAMREYLREQ